MTSFHLHSAIFDALTAVRPKQVQAGSGSFWWLTCSGADLTGASFSVHVLPNGGTGAVQAADGLCTMAFPGNGSLTPIEIMENRAPILVTERALRPDSGGAGASRGGLGQSLGFRTLGGNSAHMTLRPDKLTYGAPGLLGGKPGGLGEVWLNGGPMPLDPFILGPGQELTLRLPGGGGVGDPHRRDRAALRADVAEGVVSREAAIEIYGATEEELA